MSSNNRKITGAAVIVMSSLIVSRITGYVRTILINNLLTSDQSDALLAAFRTTDLMYNMLIGGAISAALIPILSGYLARNEEEDGWKAVGSFINIVFLSMVAVSFLGVIFAPQVVMLTAKGLTGSVRQDAIYLTRVLFPSVGFMMLAGMTNGVLNSYKRFAAAAYGPSIYNLGTALSIFVLSRFGIKYVAFGVLASAVLYFLIQISFAIPNFKFYKPKIYFRDSGFKRLFLLAIPSLGASAVVQINVLISQNFTSGFSKGSITAYTCANEVWQLAYGIFAMGLGTALLPTLSEVLSLNKVDEFKEILFNGFKTILYMVIPAAVALFVIPKPVISAIYKWGGSVDANRINTASSILMLFTFAVIAQSMLALLNRAYYASNDTKTPLYIGVTAVVMNFVFCNIFVNATGLGPAGMSLAYSIQSVVNMFIMMYLISKKFHGMRWGILFKYGIKLMGAATIMGIFLYFANRFVSVDFTKAFTLGGKINELIVLGCEVIVGMSIYFGFTMLFRIEEAVRFKNKIFGRFRRKGLTS